MSYESRESLFITCLTAGLGMAFGAFLYQYSGDPDRVIADNFRKIQERINRDGSACYVVDDDQDEEDEGTYCATRVK